MAQSTIGVKIGWAKATLNEDGINFNKPESYTYFRDITGYPSLAGTTNTIDVTTFDNLENKSYIAGLRDLGGTLEFPCMLTPEIIKEVDKAIQAQGTSPFQVYICVEFPAPLNTRYYFRGTVLELAPNDGSVDSAVEATLNVSPLSDIEHEELV